MAMKSPRKAVISQTDETYAQLLLQFIEAPFDFKKVLPQELFDHLSILATSKGFPVGYIFLPVITATNFIAAKAKVTHSFLIYQPLVPLKVSKHILL